MAKVYDNRERRRFEMETAAGLAFANYRDLGATVMITHTQVPFALSGQGVGSALVKGALDLISMSGRTVVPACPFVAHYIKSHPEYRPLVA